MSRLSVELKSRRTFGYKASDFVDALGAEDLGVAFCTRAAVDGHSDLGRRNLRALSRVFGEDDVGDDADARADAAAMWSALHKYKVKYASTSTVAVRTEQMLKCSALASWVYVLGCLAVEPACTPPEAGDAWDRIGEPSTRLEGLLAVLSALNALVYAVTCLVARLLFGRVDPHKDEELTHLSDIFQSYLLSPGLWLDFVSMIGLMAEWAHLWESPLDGVPRASQWIMLLQMGKFWRILFPDVPIQAKAESYLFLRGVVWIFMQLFLFAHLMAACLMILGNQEAAWNERSWTDQVQPLEVGCSVTYVEAVYFAVLSLTSVGYSDMLVTSRERAFNSFFLLLSQLFTAKVCADLTWLTSTHNHWEAQNQAKQAQTWVALRKMEVPWVLAKRVLAFQSYVANVHREDLAQSAFAGLSENLIKELRLCAYRKLVIQAPFLRNQTKDVISSIVGSLRDMVFLPADFVVRAGEKGGELFFIRRGSAAVYVGKDPPVWGHSLSVMTYTTGNYFGELAMLTGRPRAAWVMATSYMVCSALLYSDVEELGREHPGAFTMMIHAIVEQFQLKPSMQWSDVSVRMHEKLGFDSIEEAFEWFCDQGTSQGEDELSAKAWDEALRRLKVPELDRKIFWASIDMDNSGFITLDEFAGQVAPTWEADRRKAALSLRMGSRTSSRAEPDKLPLSLDRGRCRFTPRLDPQLSPGTATAPQMDHLSPWRTPGAEGEKRPTIDQGQASIETVNLLQEVRRELMESREHSKKLTEEIRALQSQNAKSGITG